jgi:hypothetical protein
MRTKAEILASETGLANGDDYEAQRLAIINAQTSANNAVSIMWPAADEAAMLALATAKKGHFAKRNDIQSGFKWIYILNQLPASELANWSPFAIWYTEATGGTLDFTALAQCGEFTSNSETPFPTTGGTGDAGAIMAGNTFINTGSYWNGRAMLIAKIDTPGTNADNWEVIQQYLGYTPINVENRVNEVTPSAINFPNNDAVIAYLSTQLSALIGTLGEPSTTKYVAVNDLVAALAAKADTNTITALLNGFAFKTTPCRVATTENITLNGLQTIDELLISEDDSVLVWQQTDKTQNGIYLAKDGAWVRREDANTSLKLKAATVRVTEGTENADQQFTQIHEDVIIGTNDIEFTKSGATAAFATLVGVPGDNTALAAALLLKANEADVVKKTGDQTVNGKKSFPDGFSGSYIKGTTITGNVTIDASFINKYHYVEAAAVITIPNGVMSEGNQIRFIRDTSGEVQFVVGGTAELRVAGNTRFRIAEQNAAVEVVAKTSTVVHILGALKV